MRAQTESSYSVFRFADVEVREADFSVTRNGTRLILEPKPLRVLLYFLHHRGRVIRKSELLDAVWGGTAVTEDALVRTIVMLRRLLDDDRHQPRFIETVSTVGYRFICPVESEENTGDCDATIVQSTADTTGLTSDNSPMPAVSKQPAARMKSKKRTIPAVSAMALMVALGGLWFLFRPLPKLQVGRIEYITTDGRWKRVAGTGGSDLYLNLGVPSGQGVVPVTGGQVTPLSIDLPTSGDSLNDNPLILSVSPDGSRLLVGSSWNLSSGRDLWIVDVHGGEARYLAKGFSGTWSPDGGKVLYSNLHGDLYTISSNGGEPRLLLASPAPAGKMLAVSSLDWSPDGSRIRFGRNERYWEVSADGRNPHELLPDWHATDPKYYMGAGHWTPDGDFFLFVAATSEPYQINNIAAGQQLWALDERRRWLPHPKREPFQLTNGAMLWGGISTAISRDGRTAYATAMSLRGELVSYDAKSKSLVPYLGGISADGLSFSTDGRYVVYVTYTKAQIWRANRDGSGRLLLFDDPRILPFDPEWSPDGTQILFFDWSPCERGVMYTVSSQGGTPKRLLPDDKDWQILPAWSPDGKKIVFEHVSAGVATQMSGIEFNVGATIRILELENGKVSDLPACPRTCFNPRWSPNSRFIVSRTDDNDLALFDFRTNKWSVFNLKRGSISNPRWSHDGRFIYFGDYDYPGGLFKSREPGVYRVPVTGGRAEKVIDLAGFKSTGIIGGSFVLDPNDNPILLRESGFFDIYALSLERK